MIDWDEAFEYLPGLTVELKSRPGVVDTVVGYDLTMVPPIWLKNDPCPRYPHELRVVSRSSVQACSLNADIASNQNQAGSNPGLLSIR
ncbi:MAG: hypothetical protein IGS54_29345 [Elainella sp. C42_A2020_010]|nr:hypothetical protein [Elainella sp. C42_A2020_010]